MGLKGSKTEQNLKDAFAGESQANRRYLYFANKADIEGQNDVAALFRSTAEGETGHAHGHLEFLEAVGDPATGLPIGPTPPEPEGRRGRRDARVHRHVPGHGQAARAKKASTRSPTGSRRWPRPSARTPTATRRRSTRWSTEPQLARSPNKGLACPLFVAHARTSLHHDHTRRQPRSADPPRRSTGRTPSFYDEAACDKEMERVFDICHGCRRCVSLCQSLPDAVRPGRRDRTTARCTASTRRTTGKVVDQCYLCDLCYMTKCPYVPPHPWNLDFPHLMLRAKAIKFKQAARSRPARRFLASTDVHGQFAGIPIVVQIVNAVNKTKPRASCWTRRSACIPTRGCPSWPTKRFRWSADEARPRHRGDQRRAHARQGGDLLDLLRQLQRARHRPRPAQAARAQRDPVRDRREGVVLRHAQARARRPRGGGAAQGRQHPGAGALRARRLRDRHRDPELHADVQAGAAADVPRRRRRAARARRRCSTRSSTSSRATGTAC